ELFAHLGQRAVAVRLEHDEEAAWLGAERRQSRIDLVRVVGEVVDDGDAAGFADGLEPAPKPLEAADCSGGILDTNADGVGGGDCGEGIRSIVAAWDPQLPVVTLSVCLEGEACAAGFELQIFAHEGRSGAVEAVADEV